MKNYSSLQKIISMLMIFFILIAASGCVSSKKVRVISGSEIPVSQKYYYVIHSHTSDYLLDKIMITDGILSGKAVTNLTAAGSKIHIYLPSDTLMKISSEKVLAIPVDYISRVEIADISKGRTVLFVAGCVIVVLGVIGAIGMRNMNFFPNGL